MTTKMKELPVSERPYEKMEMYGAKVLSNSELLAIVIKNGTKEETALGLAQKILKIKETQGEELKFLQDVSIEEFTRIKGIGKVKAIQLCATFEIAKRMSRPINNFKIKIKNTADVAKLVMEEMRYEKREIVKLLILDNKNIVLRNMDISLGAGNFAVIEPKEVLTEAVKMQAPKIVMIHNHPSGDPTPSVNDFRVTDRIFEAAELLGIALLDHVIIGDGKYESVFRKNQNK